MATDRETVLNIFILLINLHVCFTNQSCPNDDCGETESIHLFEMQAEVEDKEIHLTWNFNSSVSIYGFNGVILDLYKSILYVSPILQSNERKMTISYELTESESVVCLRALLNETEVLQEKCEHVSVSDLKIIIGILAGSIFIIPCILVLACIIYKDYKVRQMEKYELLHKIEENSGLPDKSPVDKSHDSSAICSKSHDSNATSHGSYDRNKTTDEDKMVETENELNEPGMEIHGTDNLSFVAEVSSHKSSKQSEVDEPGKDAYKDENLDIVIEDSNVKLEYDSEESTNETNEINQSSNTTMDEGQRPSKSKGRNNVTLKIDINLARKMAEADNYSET